MRSSWSEEEVEHCRRLLLQGLTPKDIGPLMGKTRNAVCGMVFRNPVLKQAQQERLSMMSHGDRYRHLWKPKPARQAVEQPAVHLKPAAYDARALKVALIDLRPNQCRYPVSNGTPHVFCGHLRWSDQTMYCEHHQRRCVALPHVKAVKQRPIGFGE